MSTSPSEFHKAAPQTHTTAAASSAGARPHRIPLRPHDGAPFLRASEDARTIFLVTFVAACAPLACGFVLFGWRAAAVAALCIVSCATIERMYYRLTGTPALQGRTHAYLTGLLLALTMPPLVPWYVPVVASAFAIIVGKAIFGGVGHFLWQPALVGRLAVAVIFATTMNPPAWPVLSQERLLVGDARNCQRPETYDHWRGTRPPSGADGFMMAAPRETLAPLTTGQPQFSALAYVPEDLPAAPPAALLKVPPINDLLYGAYGGGIGETCAIMIVMAGLYLIYRTYVKWQLPVMFLLSAAIVVAVAPINLIGPNKTIETVWWPLLHEGLDVGFLYVSYQMFSGELLLAAFFMATEMTSRPVTGGGQVLFGIGCGTAAMLLRLYTDLPIPCYSAVLAMNTLTPLIDSIGRPRVLGMQRFWWRFKKL